MGLNAQERNDVVELRLEKAQLFFEQAKGNVPLKYFEVVANRLYYAAYYAVSALLIAHGDAAQTHQGIIRSFSLHFVRTGIVGKEMGALYGKLYSMRLTGDYDDMHNLTAEEVLPYVEPTEELINVISTLAKNKLKELQ